jgi:hypothetical protein
MYNQGGGLEAMYKLNGHSLLKSQEKEAKQSTVFGALSSSSLTKERLQGKGA